MWAARDDKVDAIVARPRPTPGSCPMTVPAGRSAGCVDTRPATRSALRSRASAAE